MTFLLSPAQAPRQGEPLPLTHTGRTQPPDQPCSSRRCTTALPNGGELFVNVGFSSSTSLFDNQKLDFTLVVSSAVRTLPNRFLSSLPTSE